jgi:Ca2+-binding RTX toxin-like protein
MGCKKDSVTNRDTLGLKTATSGDVILTHNVGKFTVDLNAGNDTFDQGACTTPMVIWGGAGNDTIVASSASAADEYHGGAGTDTISYKNRTTGVTVTPDDAKHSGAAGAEDTIAADFEVLTGGSGDDTFVTIKGAGVTINGGAGTDTVDYHARTAGVTVTMANSKADDGEANCATSPSTCDNVGKDVENVIGTDFADTLTGNTLNNKFTPRAGNDTVNGGAGDDTFVATDADGNDTFNGGDGLDTMDYSGRITDLGVCVYMDNTATSGKCTIAVVSHAVSVTTAPTSGDLDKINTDVENVKGTTGDDYIVGNELANGISGMGGKDWLKGGAGNDTIDADKADGTCDKANVNVDCGGDPLDVVTCTGASGTMASGSQWTPAGTKCWQVQK